MTTLSSGTRLGAYEITGAAGAGGMGEVYRARDTRLNRDVAIKILPALFASDPERRARFEREAQVLAALNHPHIAQIYGIEDSGPAQALVMEFVEGVTLDELLRAPGVPAPSGSRVEMGGRSGSGAPRGLPLEEALAIARQIAEALEAAHEQGIVHRDLKPQNVKLRPDGTVKVLDFGLAKALDPTPLRDAPTDSPTITSVGTRAGTLLGTAAYMAPEQVKGRPADRRADIWSFGVLLYELLTGSAAFAGDSTSEILARVIEREPDWTRIPADTPPTVVRLLRRAVVKDPKRRLQSIGDARLDLEDASADPAPAVAQGTGRSAPSSWRRVLALSLLGAGLLAAGAMAGRWMAAPATAVSAVRAAIALPDGLYLDGLGPPTLALSPDGRTLAFIARAGGDAPRLYVRPLDTESATPVPGSETVEGPFFSPDGRWVGFAVGVSVMGGMPPELRKYSLDTGLTQTIARVTDFFGGVWLADGRILFVNHQPSGLWTVDAGGGEPRAVISRFLVDGQEVHRAIAWPAMLPDGRALLVTDWERSRIGHLAVVDLETRQLTGLGLEGSGAQLLPDGGSLVYGGVDAALMTVPFDARARRVRGTPSALMPGIAFGRNNVPVFAFSRTGTFVYATGFLRFSRREPMRLVRGTEGGAVAPLAFEPDLYYRGLALSPDGSRLVLATWDASRWVFDLRRGTRVKLPGQAIADVHSLMWSPEGRRLAASGPLSGSSVWGLVIESLDEPGRFVKVTEVGEDELKVAGWTPDGRTIIVCGARMDSGTIIRRFDVGGAGEIIAQVPGAVSSIRVSPDGRWLAYDLTTGGPFEVFVIPIGGKAAGVPVSPRGGETPRWSSDGRRLYFQRGDTVLAVDVKVTDGEPNFGPERRVVQWNAGREYDVAPDGSVYGIEPLPDAAMQRSIQLRTGWFR